MVEDAHGEGRLCQLSVGHDAVGLEAFVLRRPHAGEVDAVLRAPVVLLQVAQVVCHHRDIRSPFLLQTYQYTHPDAMNASLSHAVEAVDAPFELALHAARMIDVVVYRYYVSYSYVDVIICT